MRVAFSGRARAGKNKAAELLQNQGFIELRFSDKLYEIHDKVFEMVGAPVQKCGPLLQIIGTEVGRNYDPDIWVKHFQSKLDSLPANTDVVVTDCRFPNEVDVLKRNGFKVIRVHRINRPATGRDDNHISETALDYYDFDYNIYNNGTVEELYEQVKEALKLP